MAAHDVLPSWSVSGLYESLDAREFRAALERAIADVADELLGAAACRAGGDG